MVLQFYCIKWNAKEAIFIFDELERNVKTLVHLNRNGKLFHPNNTHTDMSHLPAAVLYIDIWLFIIISFQ